MRHLRSDEPKRHECDVEMEPGCPVCDEPHPFSVTMTTHRHHARRKRR